jgi:hypothetical protein
MLDDVSVKLYFGNGQIRYGEHGVDLSEFDSVDHVIRRAGSRTWGSITDFFYRAFHVDAEQHDLSIMTLINRSESVCWKLMPLQGTEYWRSYIKTTCEIGLPVMLFIQVVHKAGSSSQVHEEGSDAHQGEAELQAGNSPATEPQEGDGASTEEEEGDGDTPFESRCEIDEGEVNEEVLKRYKMEADEDECGLEEDDPLVPRDWESYNFSQLSVNLCENVSWEYRDNKVSIGAMYKSAVEVKDAVKRWATLTL